MSRHRRIAVIGTGGTISSLSDDPLDVIEYPESGRKLDAAEVLARVPAVDRVADCVALPFRSVGSASIGPAEWIALASRVEEACEGPEGFDGAVILHGTATLEETAWFLHLVVKTAKPVVVVGAQRPLSAIGGDGPMNLVAAVRAAAEPDCAGLGVLVLLNDELHSAREATKTSTLRLQTFRSPDFGLLGHVDGDRVALYRRPLRAHTTETEFSAADLGALPRVDIVPAYAGADAAAVDAFRAAGARGLVSAGLAPGLTPPLQRRALEAAAAEGVVVVQSTRSLGGRVVRRRALREAEIVAADNLSPQKARILLMLALTRSAAPESVQAAFDRY